MRIKGLIEEDFCQYKEPSMFISTATCSFKCEKESGVRCCQNSDLAQSKTLTVDNDTIIKRYLDNPITKAIIFGGLEPFDQIDEILEFIASLRIKYKCDDTVVIYTGYNKIEILYLIDLLRSYKNLIIKFGRFVPEQQSHRDEILGVELASPNQHAEKIT